MTDLSLNWRATSDYSVRVVSRTAKTTQLTPRNTSPLVLIRCDGSHAATLLSPGSHAFRRCKQGLYKQNISRKVHTLLVVDENGDVTLQHQSPNNSIVFRKKSISSSGSTTKMITVTPVDQNGHSHNVPVLVSPNDSIQLIPENHGSLSYTVQKSNVTHTLVVHDPNALEIKKKITLQMGRPTNVNTFVGPMEFTLIQELPVVVRVNPNGFENDKFNVLRSNGRSPLQMNTSCFIRTGDKILPPDDASLRLVGKKCLIELAPEDHRRCHQQHSSSNKKRRRMERENKDQKEDEEDEEEKVKEKREKREKRVKFAKSQTTFHHSDDPFVCDGQNTERIIVDVPDGTAIAATIAAAPGTNEPTDSVVTDMIIADKLIPSNCSICNNELVANPFVQFNHKEDLEFLCDKCEEQLKEQPDSPERKRIKTALRVRNIALSLWEISSPKTLTKQLGEIHFQLRNKTRNTKTRTKTRNKLPTSPCTSLDFSEIMVDQLVPCNVDDDEI